VKVDVVLSRVAANGARDGIGDSPGHRICPLPGWCLDGSVGKTWQSHRQLVCRTPVRQAFLQLEAEGLLELYPRRGALVVPISPSEAEDVLEARLLIEQHCARSVAAEGARGIPGLHDAIAEQQRALADGGTGFIVADRRFHRAIVAANGNALLTRQYDTLRDRQQRIAATAVARDPARIVRFIAEHEELVAAIERGDPAAAAQLTAAHLRGADALARRPRSLSATP
jgi:DNA-binding GntR family transcriptional regulator